MTRYNEDAGDVEGDFDDQLDYSWQGGYREGVEAVISWITREGLAYAHDIRNAIDRGEI